MSFKIFVGIDQTGAVNSKGLPRPLHCSLIDARKSRPKFFVGIALASLTHQALLEVLRAHIPDFDRDRVLICVDSVLGLPAELRVPISSVLRLARHYSFQGKAYGAQTAYQFFDQFISADGRDKLPTREAEILVKANSVFNLKPFQRNIGCGTYRVLRDLAVLPCWFSIWPLQVASTQFVIAEGYPSYFWKTLLKSRTRDLEVIQRLFPKLRFLNYDQADSFLLAYGAWKSKSQIQYKGFPKHIRLEGWILGLPR